MFKPLNLKQKAVLFTLLRHVIPPVLLTTSSAGQTTVPSRVIFLLSCLLKLVMVVLRLACLQEAEDHVAVIVMLGTAPYFLFFCRG